MVTSFADPFQRVFPRRDLLRGAARSSVLWSTLGSLTLFLLLFDLFLVADLLETRGRLQVPAGQTQALARLAGQSEQLRDGKNLPPAGRRTWDGTGLLPTVWHWRHRPWGPALAAVYRRVPWLEDNGSALMVLIAVAVGLTFFRGLVLAKARSCSAEAAQDVAARLRRSIHRQALRLGPSDLSETGTQEADELFTRTTDRVREGVMRWIDHLGREPFLLVGLVLLALSIQWQTALQCLIPLAFCWYLVQRATARSESTRQLARSRADAELYLLAGSLRKTRLVRGYGMEHFEHEQFQNHLNRFRNRIVSATRSEDRLRLAFLGLTTLAVAIVLFFLGTKALQPPGAPHGLSLSAALFMLATFACMYAPLQALWQLPADRADASAAADRIYRYLNRVPEVSQAVGAKFLQPLSRSLQFESVTYRPPNGKRLLVGLDLKVPAGESAAFVSLDPLEARALAYLLPRFIEPQSGRVLFDGEDIAWVTLESLRAETVYVGGADPCFTGTVLENISCGNSEYSLQEITDAAKTVHAHNFILKLPQGYETLLGEHGEQLEPGQAFRLGLARAVLRDPALLVIEEPDESLDTDTKTLIDDAYSRIIPGRTVVFLPARLSTVRRSDRIVLLNRGRIEAVGPYSKLLKSSDLYRHWEYSRFNVFRHELEPVSG